MFGILICLISVWFVYDAVHLTKESNVWTDRVDSVSDTSSRRIDRF